MLVIEQSRAAQISSRDLGFANVHVLHIIPHRDGPQEVLNDNSQRPKRITEVTKTHSSLALLSSTRVNTVPS